MITVFCALYGLLTTLLSTKSGNIYWIKPMKCEKHYLHSTQKKEAYKKGQEQEAAEGKIFLCGKKKK